MRFTRLYQISQGFLWFILGWSIEFKQFFAHFSHLLVKLDFSLDKLSHLILCFALKLQVSFFNIRQFFYLLIDIRLILSPQLPRLLLHYSNLFLTDITQTIQFPTDFGQFLFKGHPGLSLHLSILQNEFQLLVLFYQLVTFLLPGNLQLFFIVFLTLFIPQESLPHFDFFAVEFMLHVISNVANVLLLDQGWFKGLGQFLKLLFHLHYHYLDWCDWVVLIVEDLLGCCCVNVRLSVAVTYNSAS